MDKYAGTMSNWAYEMDDGRGERYWAFLNEDGVMVDLATADLFMDRFDFWRALGYDTIINTYESWEALDA
jgi:hypothetical protein